MFVYLFGVRHNIANPYARQWTLDAADSSIFLSRSLYCTVRNQFNGLKFKKWKNGENETNCQGVWKEAGYSCSLWSRKGGTHRKDNDSTMSTSSSSENSSSSYSSEGEKAAPKATPKSAPKSTPKAAPKGTPKGTPKKDKVSWFYICFYDFWFF